MSSITAAEILIALIAIGVFSYSVYKAIKISKTNKANDEASRRIFLSQIDGVTIDANGMPVAVKKKKKEETETEIKNKPETIKKTASPSSSTEEPVKKESEEKEEKTQIKKETIKEEIKTENEDVEETANFKLKDFFED